MTKIVSSGGTISTETFLEKKRRAKRRRLTFISIALAILLVLIVVVSRLGSLRVGSVEVSGAKVIGTEEVTAVVDDILNGYYLWIVPHDNAVVYPRYLIKKMLLRKFPRFSSVNLSLSGLQTLKVDVVEREPFALYCGASETAESSACYFLDDQGFIFDAAPTFSNGVYFVYARSDAFAEPLAQEYLPREQFHALAAFIDKVRTLGFDPQSVVMESDHFKLISSEHRQADLLWSREADLDLIYSNLESFLASEAIRKETNFLEKTAELDLRTDNKVFYRFK